MTNHTTSARIRRSLLAIALSISAGGLGASLASTAVAAPAADRTEAAAPTATSSGPSVTNRKAGKEQQEFLVVSN